MLDQMVVFRGGLVARQAVATLALLLGALGRISYLMLSQSSF